MRKAALVSGKGGVGRTALTANLGSALARSGEAVLAVDFDVQTPALDLAVGESARMGWAEVLNGAATLEEAQLSPHNGFSVLPWKGGQVCDAFLAESMSGEMLTQLESQSEADWLLMDTRASADPATLRLAGAADLVLFVLTPEPASLAASFVLARTLQTDSPWSILVNQADSAKHAQETASRFQEVCSQFLSRRVRMMGWVGRDEVAAAASRRMELWPQASPKAQCAKQILAVAEELKAWAAEAVEPEAAQELAQAA